MPLEFDDDLACAVFDAGRLLQPIAAIVGAAAPAPHTGLWIDRLAVRSA
ncbi:MAG: hypothetical protein HQL41_08545, partial [Alphaproteobacteria bacterium]|nr:hypothetical protein [Alphaproteobacteria bacterium]